ncbi:MAG: glycosyltransferase family 2 protein [Pseudobutyrivibrio sp.]|nr:glycosyltransferase family 2 protein [Pseudobutyrivibrio sp.]
MRRVEGRYNMNYYPVLIPTVNRYEHLKKCIESLRKNTHSEKTELVVILDYPANNSYKEGWKKIKEYLPTVSGFKKVTIIEREKNYFFNGLDIDDVKSEYFNKYGAIIFTEDDNVFSPCFLDYMDKCLDYYKNNEEVVGISAYMRPITLFNRDGASVIKYYDPMPWGYGTWKEKEEIIKNELIKNYVKTICDSKKLLSKFCEKKAPLYAAKLWSMRLNHLPLTSDVYRYCYNISNEKYVIHPLKSLARNEGHDGTGVHCEADVELQLKFQEISEEEVFTINDCLGGDEYEKNKEILDEYFLKGIFSSIQSKRDAQEIYDIYFEYGYDIGESRIDDYYKKRELGDAEYRKKWIEIDKKLNTLSKDKEKRKEIDVRLDGKKIIVFGKGKYGKKCYSLLHNDLNVENIVIWDNLGGECEVNDEKIQVKIPEEKELSKDYCIVITPIRFYSEIVKQLNELNFNNDDFISIEELVDNI